MKRDRRSSSKPDRSSNYLARTSWAKSCYQRPRSRIECYTFAPLPACWQSRNDGRDRPGLIRQHPAKVNSGSSEMIPQRPFGRFLGLLSLLFEIAAKSAAGPQANGQAHGQHAASHQDDESGEEDVAGELELIGGHDDGNEHDHDSHHRGQTPREGKVFVDRPYQHAAAEILAERD